MLRPTIPHQRYSAQPCEKPQKAIEVIMMPHALDCLPHCLYLNLNSKATLHSAFECCHFALLHCGLSVFYFVIVLCSVCVYFYVFILCFFFFKSYLFMFNTFLMGFYRILSERDNPERRFVDLCYSTCFCLWGTQRKPTVQVNTSLQRTLHQK